MKVEVWKDMAGNVQLKAVGHNSPTWSLTLLGTTNLVLYDEDGIDELPDSDSERPL